MIQAVIVSPEVTYAPEALSLISDILPFVQRAIAEGIRFAGERDVAIYRVAVTRFDSYEDPDWHEAVVTFHAVHPASLEAWSVFWEGLCQRIGDWEQLLPEPQKEFFFRSVSIQIDPVDHV